MTLSRTSKLLGSMALAAVACAGCGGSSNGSGTTALQQQLLSITKSTNAQLAKDQKGKTPTVVDKNYAEAFSKAAGEFRALNFPTSARADAKKLEAILDTMATQATAVSKAAAKPQTVEANVEAMAQLNLKLLDTEKTERPAANKLRHDIGLGDEPTTTQPPAPSTTFPVAPGESTTTTPAA
jgi:hypothetical protein